MTHRVKEAEPYDFLVKLLILGDSSVGKSSLMNRFCSGTFNSSHVATIGVDFKYKTIECDSKRIKLQIWDTAGQEKYRSIVKSYYKGAMGIILTYAINDRRSFQNVESWMKQISTNAAQGVIILLVGNKSDLSERVVETSEGQKMADNHNIGFLEVSAKDGTYVYDAFQELSKQIKNKIHEDPSLLNEINAGASNQAANIIKLDQQTPAPETLVKANKQQTQTSGGCKC